jgi:hypothetical protein
MKKITALIVTLVTLSAKPARAAEFMDYFSGCLISMAGGLAGTAFANTRLESGQKIDTTGYAIAGGLSCIAGMSYVGVTSSRAQFEAEYTLKSENEELSFQLKRLSKERCLLNDTCKPGGRAIIVDTETEIKKQGDKVFEVETSTIEPNE